MNKNKVLLLGAGLHQIELIKDIQALGFHVTAVDRDQNVPGALYADDFYAIDIIDGPKINELCNVKKINAIVPVNDVGVKTAAFVCTRSGLKGINQAAAELSNNKVLMRQKWSESGLSQPLFRKILCYKDLEDAASDLGYPLVIKPADCGGGSRGVAKIWSKNELQWAFNNAKKYAFFADELIVEQYVLGTEITVEGIVCDQIVHILAVSDKQHFNNHHYCVASSLNYPADLDDDTLNKIHQLACTAVLALGINQSLFHMEMIVNSGTPFLLELSARGGGSQILSNIVKWVSGVNYLQEYIKLLLGQSYNVANFKRRAAVFRFLSAQPGRIKTIKGLEKCQQYQGVDILQCLKKVGDTVSETTMDNERLGFMVIKTETREEAMALADRVINEVEIITEPI